MMVFSTSGWVMAQSLLCDNIVIDQANLFGKGITTVETAANRLVQQGADVRIRTVGYSTNLDITEKQMENQCASWESGSGGRKSTLIVFMLAGNHKVGIMYGSAWHSALDGNWNRIMTSYMIPRFKDGNYALGMSTGIEQFSLRLAASKDEALHPVQNTTNVQATDYKGLWTVLLWCLGLGFLIFIIAAGYIACTRWAEIRDAKAKAKRLAQVTKNQCIALVLTLKSAFQSDPPEKSIQDMFDTYMEEFSNMENSDSMDPKQSMTEDGYQAITKEYRILIDKFESLRSAHKYVQSPMATEQPAEQGPPIDTADVNDTTGYNQVRHHHQHHNIEQRPTYEPTPTSTPNNDLLTGVLIGESINNRPRVEEIRREEPRREESTYRAPDPEPDRESESGGSSSWGSSDSSSSFDSGGSSSFDSSSSSDSGGGGSSDF